MPRFEKGSDEAKAYMKSIREARKLTNNYEKMKGHENLIMTNTAEITVPKTLLHIDDKGEQKIIKSVTKSGNLTRRDKKPVIKIEPKTNKELIIINHGKTKKSFSNKIQVEIHGASISREQRKNNVDNPNLSWSTDFSDNRTRNNRINYKNDTLHAPRLNQSKKMKQITDKVDKLWKRKIKITE